MESCVFMTDSTEFTTAHCSTKSLLWEGTHEDGRTS